MSHTTSSSHGGVSFEELCSGLIKNYSFNLANLTGKTTPERIDALKIKIVDTIQSLENKSPRRIERFYIGKTYAGARANKAFNPTDLDTWTLAGISSRWTTTYKEDCDGLVVLGAINRGMLKQACNTLVWDQQKYALALENALITHFAFEECDPRLANTTLNPGQLQQKLSDGYLIYLAFKYEDPLEDLRILFEQSTI